ncbi:hypothetical protein LOZ65_006807 [Ophidiomyces ophidiicola]|nr:hypothetical protein LOZ65_006807 [Ophidiomyces ophidiicola]
MEIQLGEDRDILSALDTLSSASSDTLMRLRKQVTKTIGQVNQKLAQKPPLTDGLLDTILKSMKKIHSCLQKSEEELTRQQWTSEDPQITDIRNTSGRPTDEERFHSYLSEQSLALEKEAWKLKTYEFSRVNDFVSDLTATSEDHNGTIKEFVRFKGFSDEQFAIKGIIRGQKCLVNERLYPLRHGSSAIYSLRSDSFRRVPYPSLPALNDLLGQKKYEDICQLVQAKCSFLKRCQALYDDQNNAIIGLLKAGPQRGLSATGMPFIGMGRDGTNVRIEEILEQSAQGPSPSAQGAQLSLMGAEGVALTTPEESSSFRGQPSSEAFADEEVTRLRQNGASRRTGAKRRRPNDIRSEQGRAPNQHRLIHRFQEMQSQAEGATRNDPIAGRPGSQLPALASLSPHFVNIYSNAQYEPHHHETGTGIPGGKNLPSVETRVPRSIHGSQQSQAENDMDGHDPTRLLPGVQLPPLPSLPTANIHPSGQHPGYFDITNKSAGQQAQLSNLTHASLDGNSINTSNVNHPHLLEHHISRLDRLTDTAAQSSQPTSPLLWLHRYADFEAEGMTSADNNGTPIYAGFAPADTCLEPVQTSGSDFLQLGMHSDFVPSIAQSCRIQQPVPFFPLAAYSDIIDTNQVPQLTNDTNMPAFPGIPNTD